LWREAQGWERQFVLNSTVSDWLVGRVAVRSQLLRKPVQFDKTDLVVVVGIGDERASGRFRPGRVEYLRQCPVSAPKEVEELADSFATFPFYDAAAAFDSNRPRFFHIDLASTRFSPTCSGVLPNGGTRQRK
jgi:hypothetical protein